MILIAGTEPSGVRTPVPHYDIAGILVRSLVFEATKPRIEVRRVEEIMSFLGHFPRVVPRYCHLIEMQGGIRWVGIIAAKLMAQNAVCDG